MSPQFKSAQLIYDTNLTNFESAKGRIDAALEAGKSVQIVHVYREPGEAYQAGVLPRARGPQGHPVSVEGHARTHAGSNETVRRLAVAYAGDDRVKIRVVDNSRGHGNAAVIPIEELPRVEYNAVRDEASRILEAERQAGSLSDALYRASRGAQPERRAGGQDRAVGGGRPQQEVRQKAKRVEQPAGPAPAAKPNFKTPDARTDSALEYLAKYRGDRAGSAGVNFDEAVSEGFDPADLKGVRHGIRRAFTKKGMTLESSGEALAQRLVIQSLRGAV